MPTLPRSPRAHRHREQLQARRLRAAELFRWHPPRRDRPRARRLPPSRQQLACRLESWWARCAAQPRTVRPDTAAVRRPAQHDRDGAAAGGRGQRVCRPAVDLERIALVIERLTGLRHHPAHLWAILHHRLGWSVQRPRRRAAERDQAAIDHWVKVDWPRIKKRQPPPGGHLLLRRVRVEPDSQRALDLGAAGQPAHPGAPVQLEARLDGRRLVLRRRWRRRPACLPPPGRQLRRRHPHQGPW